MRNIGRSVWVLAIVTGLWASLGTGGGSASAQARAGQPADGKSSEVRSGGPELRLGKLDHPPSRLASLPLYFRAGQAKSVGSIRAEIAIPTGSWIFQTVEAPKGAWWKVSSKDKSGEKSKDSANPRGFTIIEVTISGGNRVLGDGLIGYLEFQVTPAGSLVPAGLSVRKIEVASPSTGVSRPGLPGQTPPPVPEQPTPAPSCFFFAH